jgi:hypothetical protein
LTKYKKLYFINKLHLFSRVSTKILSETTKIISIKFDVWVGYH